ncbi:MAG: hypothetical protein IPM96_22035 [Ignavibacteria bacterium]|nr:hypothetical protein [Ignavibacteria bacterium]
MTESIYNDNRAAVIGVINFLTTFTSLHFRKNFSGVNNIIALAGINFGFSRRK